MRLAVIIPTVGRPTLTRTLRALIPQLVGDVVYIAGQPASSFMVPFGAGTIRLMKMPSGGDSGDSERNAAIDLAIADGDCTHVCFIDDDDEHTPGALAAIRRHERPFPVLFRMRHPELGVLWRRRVVEPGNVGTPMVVAPLDPQLLGRFAAPPLEKTGDATFICDTVARFGRCEFDEYVVADCHRVAP